MRTYSHPVLAALRYLQHCRTPETAIGTRPAEFAGEDQALAVLRRYSGKDFGADLLGWREWYRHNRWAFDPVEASESTEPRTPKLPLKPVDQSITDTWIESDRRD
jgi:hypothetical protein